MGGKFFVVPAPGHFQDATTVMSSHRTLSAAKKAAGPGYVVRSGALKKGDTYYRSADAVHPVAE